MKNYVDRWDSDVFENKEISKLIYQDVKKKLKVKKKTEFRTR